MTTRNVVEFPHPGRDGYRPWAQDELQQLLALYTAQAAAGEATSWEIGETEAGEPQFYLLGHAPAHDCVTCVSRVGRLYVLEDGGGEVVAEESRLKAIAEIAARRLRRRSTASLVVRTLLALCTFRALIEPKLEPFLAESTENWTRIAPHLAALI